MSEVLIRFDKFFKEFKLSPLWWAMVNTQEASPWHREANVSVHTLMLLDWYKDNLMPNRNEKQQMLTMIACLFHDVGKPNAQILKSSPERGEYRAYHGHEQLSARMWVDYALTFREAVTYGLRFDLDDIANIALMLEHHVPFGLKDKVKRLNLKNAFVSRMGEAGHRAYLDFLLSDQHGRISDDRITKLAEVDVWMQEWEKLT